MSSVAATARSGDSGAGTVGLLGALRTRVSTLVITRGLRAGRVLERRAGAVLTLDPGRDGRVQAVGGTVGVDVGKAQAAKVVVDLVAPEIVGTGDVGALVVGVGGSKRARGEVGVGDRLGSRLKEAAGGDRGRRGDGDEAERGQRGEEGEAHGRLRLDEIKGRRGKVERT